jgi:hypothetical protein
LLLASTQDAVPAFLLLVPQCFNQCLIVVSREIHARGDLVIFDLGHAVFAGDGHRLFGIGDLRVEPAGFCILGQHHRHALVNLGGGAGCISREDRATGLPLLIVRRFPHRHHAGKSEELVVGRVGRSAAALR